MDIWSKMDAVELKPVTNTPLPEGDYTAEITDVEIKEDIFGIGISVEFTMLEPNPGRKAWFSSKLDENSSPAKLGFVKRQICAMAGVESTNGNPVEVLAGVKGNNVSLTVKHAVGTKDPSKTYVNVYVNGLVDKF